MIAFDKTMFYDWYGKNASWFKTINHFHNDTYDSIMILISKLADSHYALLYVAVFAAWALCNFAAKKARSNPGANQYALRWMAALIVLVVSLKLDNWIIHYIKDYFAYPRPYAALGMQNVHLLSYRGEHSPDDFMSFPSGHVSAVTVFVISLYPLLSDLIRKFAFLLILLVAWSRMAMGMHFPADVLAGFLISFIITIIIRFVVYNMLRTMRVRC